MTGVTAQSADIWLLDRALRWHYMAPTFVNYYCQMMIHIGLPQWQLAFTDIGLMPQAKVTFTYTTADSSATFHFCLTGRGV